MKAKRQQHEIKLQFRMVRDLRWMLPRNALMWMVPNGGDMTVAARKKAAGMGEYPGASDLMVLWDGRLYCLELKVRASKLWGIPKTTSQTPEQIEFQAAVEAAGGRYAVVRTVDEALAFLASHGVPLRLSARSMPAEATV